jgi:molecular chaperone GrpE
MKDIIDESVVNEEDNTLNNDLEFKGKSDEKTINQNDNSDEVIESKKDDEVVTHDIEPITSTLLDEVNNKLSQLSDHFEASLKYDAHKDKIIDRLHEELQEYKNDLLFKATQSIINDLIQFHDDANKMINHFNQKQDNNLYNDVINIFQDFKQYILDILEKNDVFMFNNDEHIYDPKKQQVIKTKQTDNPKINKNIASILRSGFKRYDKIIRPEGVEVYVYKKENQTSISIDANKDEQ